MQFLIVQKDKKTIFKINEKQLNQSNLWLKKIMSKENKTLNLHLYKLTDDRQDKATYRRS